MQVEPCAALPKGWFHLSIALPPGRAYVAQEWAAKAEQEWSTWEQASPATRGEFCFSDDLQFTE